MSISPANATLSFRRAAEAATRSRLPWPVADVAVLVSCVGAVIAIRLRLLVGTDFPINDGALFLAFVQAIATSFPAIPQMVDYNGMAIPFAYPPLSFWLSAAAVRLGADPLQIVHRLPILMNIAYVLMFTVLLRRTGHSRLFTGLAVLVFGTTFLSYEWLVMGGGLSRGFGSLFLMLTLLALLPAATLGQRDWSLRQMVTGGLCVGGAVLCHLEWGILATASALVCLALPRPGWMAYLRAVVTLGLAAGALVLPWLAFVYQAHGLDPFIAAAQTGSMRADVIPRGIARILTSFSVLVPFMLLGGLAALRSRHAFWLLFILAALLLTPRGGRTPLMLALGVLTAAGLLTSVALLQQWTGPRQRHVLITLVLLGCGLAGLRTLHAVRPAEHFTALPAELRQAMAWVAQTHPGARFAVFKEAPWYYNAVAEWFPVLARAVNTTTVQGREWLPGQDFQRTELAVEALNSATSCEQLMQGLSAFPRADFVWAESVDLQARAATLADRLSALTGGWVQQLSLGIRSAMADDAREGARPHSGRPALRGPGTLAGCFDAAGYQEVHANGRVRIFRVPAQP